MKRYVPVLFAFAAGFAVCWVVRDDPPSSLKQISGVTVMKPGNTAQDRQPSFLRVVHEIDADKQESFPEIFARRNEYWAIHLTVNERTLILLAEPVDLPLDHTMEGNHQR